MSNQRWNNVKQANVEIYNVETTLSKSTLNCNVEQRRINLAYFNVDLNKVRKSQSNMSFSTYIFPTLSNVETTLWIWPYGKKKIKPWVKNKIIFLSFKEYTGLKIFFILFSILRGIYRRIFAESQKFLKHWIYWITKTIFKPCHFVKCQLVFIFTKRHVQARYDYQSFNFIYIF